MSKLIKTFNHFLPIKNFETYNCVQISERAIIKNLNIFRRLTQKQIIAVLKANAYGHGTEQIAMILAANRPVWLSYLAVDSYAEALRIAKVCDLPVLIMGKIKPTNFKSLKNKRFSFVISDTSEVEAMAKQGRKFTVHLEINSGMNRYGVNLEQLPDLLYKLKQASNIKVEGLMTHLADADGIKSQNTLEQVKIFKQALKMAEAALGRIPIKHIGQTAGSLRLEKTGVDNAIRLGIGLYGINPFDQRHPSYKKLTKLEPALRVVSTVSALQNLRPGQKVSYNYIFTAKRKTAIAIVPFGYYEGLPRELSNRGAVLLIKNGQLKLVPIVGRVCMNHTMIDVTGLGCKVGDQVFVLGGAAKLATSIQSLASAFGLFSYSLLTGINQTNKRQVISNFNNK